MSSPPPPVTTLHRIGFALIDGAIFVLLWFVVVGVTEVKVPFAPMQSYTPEDYRAYLTVVGIMTAIIFVQSVLAHVAFGGSIGKRISGAKTLAVDGQPLTVWQSLARSGFLFVLGLLILAPGPIAAYLQPRGSEHFSFTLLAGGLLLLVVATLPRLHGPGTGRSVPLHEGWLGIETIKAPNRTIDNR